MSKFQGHAKLCSKYRTSMVSSWNLRPVCWWKEFFFIFECCFCHCYPRLNFTCTSYIICYVIEIVEIFHILRLFLTYHNLYWGDGCLLIVIEIFKFLLFYQLNPVAPLIPRPVAQGHCINERSVESYNASPYSISHIRTSGIKHTLRSVFAFI